MAASDFPCPAHFYSKLTGWHHFKLPSLGAERRCFPGCVLQRPPPTAGPGRRRVNQERLTLPHGKRTGGWRAGSDRGSRHRAARLLIGQFRQAALSPKSLSHREFLKNPLQA